MKQGKVPKGIVTSQAVSSVKETSLIPKNEIDFVRAIITTDPKKLPAKPQDTGRYLFDQASKSQAPRNVYRETVHTTDGESTEYVWWHCEDGSYVGRFEVTRIDPKTEEKFLMGYDYNIVANKENLKKVMSFKTSKTCFYRKYQDETRKIEPEDFS